MLWVIRKKKGPLNNVSLFPQVYLVVFFSFSERLIKFMQMTLSPLETCKCSFYIVLWDDSSAEKWNSLSCLYKKWRHFLDSSKAFTSFKFYSLFPFFNKQFCQDCIFPLYFPLRKNENLKCLKHGWHVVYLKIKLTKYFHLQMVINKLKWAYCF